MSIAQAPIKCAICGKPIALERGKAERGGEACAWRMLRCQDQVEPAQSSCHRL